MLELIIFITVTVCFAIIIFTILDGRTEEEEIIQERLIRISRSSSSAGPASRNANVLDFIISKYCEPIIHKISQRQQEEVKEKTRKDLRQLLMESGKPYSDDDILRFRAFQVFFAALAVVLGLVVGVLMFRNNISMFFLFIVVFVFLGFKFPILFLRMEIKRRGQEIAYNLPDALDLLVVCVEAGLGLDAALTKVSVEQSRTAPVLARELGRVSKDVLAGVPRQEAFRNLALRNNVQELKSLVALLIQTDKLGTSISQSLRVYADTVRTKRRQKAEKLAAEASVKMVIPLVLFILPSMFVVLLGPAILNLIQQFTGQ